MDNSLFGYGQHDLSTDVPAMAPIAHKEHTPLSTQPVPEGVCMPTNNPVDQLVLEACAPQPGQQEEGHCQDKQEPKDTTKVIMQTEKMISYGIKQIKRTIFINEELQLLLKHELKILEQVMTRIEKFKNLRDENKRKALEWENLYKSEIPEYDGYTTKLVNVPHNQILNVEGCPIPVQQKILFQIVSRTTNTANRVLVQLSMEETVTNDIDLTLSDLKKHVTVMIRQINCWLKNITDQVSLQETLLERWTNGKAKVKELRDRCDEGRVESTTSASLKPYEDRLKKIEYAICCMLGPSYGTCKFNKPPKDPCPCPDSPINQEECQKAQNPSCPPTPGPPTPQQNQACPPQNNWMSAQPQNPCCPPIPGPPTPQQNQSFQNQACPPQNNWMSAQNSSQCDPIRGNGSPSDFGRDCVSPQQLPACPIEEEVFRQCPTPAPPGQIPYDNSMNPAGACPGPGMGQQVDPSLLPKIQGDLQRLAERNRNLQDLVNNFRRVRANLTDEIDKAVQLNQKLQRDLQCVVESHKQ